MIPFTARPVRVNIPGIFRHSGDTQFFLCVYVSAIKYVMPNHQWWWLFTEAGDCIREVNLESWEVGQMLGGN